MHQDVSTQTRHKNDNPSVFGLPVEPYIEILWLSVLERRAYAIALEHFESEEGCEH